MITRHRLRWRIQHWLENRVPGLLTCAEFQQTLDDYIDGALGRAGRMIVDIHLKTCPTCRRYMSAYRKVRDIAPRALDTDETKALGEIPEDLVLAIIMARKAQPDA
ncbi:MAG: zf-HC2 domain-containing protein [Alphaproteobacteria bacterium]|nr:zf-HC2 domain-containing protein [Alphaproteobacteria bacterium]